MFTPKKLILIFCVIGLIGFYSEVLAVCTTATDIDGVAAGTTFDCLTLDDMTFAGVSSSPSGPIVFTSGPSGSGPTFTISDFLSIFFGSSSMTSSSTSMSLPDMTQNMGPNTAQSQANATNAVTDSLNQQPSISNPTPNLFPLFSEGPTDRGVQLASASTTVLNNLNDNFMGNGDPTFNSQQTDLVGGVNGNGAGSNLPFSTPEEVHDYSDELFIRAIGGDPKVELTAGFLAGLETLRYEGSHQVQETPKPTAGPVGRLGTGLTSENLSGNPLLQGILALGYSGDRDPGQEETVTEDGGMSILENVRNQKANLRDLFAELSSGKPWDYQNNLSGMYQGAEELNANVHEIFDEEVQRAGNAQGIVGDIPPLVKRGDFARVAKSQNVQDQSGGGMLLANLPAALSNPPLQQVNAPLVIEILEVEKPLDEEAKRWKDNAEQADDFAKSWRKVAKERREKAGKLPDGYDKDKLKEYAEDADKLADKWEKEAQKYRDQADRAQKNAEQRQADAEKAKAVAEANRKAMEQRSADRRAKIEKAEQAIRDRQQAEQAAREAEQKVQADIDRQLRELNTRLQQQEADARARASAAQGSSGGQEGQTGSQAGSSSGQPPVGEASKDAARGIGNEFESGINAIADRQAALKRAMGR